MADRLRSGGGAELDAGFTLIETIVSMFILSILVTASVPFFVSVLAGSSGLGVKQAAITVASRQLEYVRSVAPANLVTGRNPADVAALIAAPGLVDLGGDLTATGNSDASAPAGSANAAVPLVQTQILNGTTYTVRTYINVCYLSRTTGTCTASASNGPAAYRVSVDVAWARAPQSPCSSGRAGQCEFVTVTLIDASQDPIFSVNSAPVITALLDATTAPAVNITALHPGQQITLQVVGSNFAYGATLIGGGGDIIGPVTSNTGSSLTATLQVSPLVGARSIVVANPDGSSATAILTVATSTPTITALTPGTAARLTAKTFTLTGTDFFATPSSASPILQPTVSMSGTYSLLGFPIVIIPTITNVTVINSTSLTFKATFPLQLTGYTTTGTLTLTNPDGGSRTFAYSIAVS